MVPEVVVTVAIALFTTLGAATRQLHSKMDALDRRVDQHELRVAQNYLSKEEFTISLDRVEAHMIRIENKLDKLMS